MTKKRRAEIVAGELDRLYPAPCIPLKAPDAFTFLVAVVLSAQCTDKRVNEVTPELFALADTPLKMSRLEVEQIRGIIRPCGLSEAKARNIKSLSTEIVSKFGGRVPDNFKDLESLAGVGHKTASVIMQQVYGVPAFPVDTHIHRLAKRWGLSSGRSVEQTEADLKKLYPPQDWGKLHLQFIYYGREHCKAHTCKRPDNLCRICRLVRGCEK